MNVHWEQICANRTATTQWGATVVLAILATPSIGMDTHVVVSASQWKLDMHTWNILMTTIITDIDECILGIDTCHHICKNTVGSYICTCGQGYRMADNGTCIGNAAIPSALPSSWFDLWYICFWLQTLTSVLEGTITVSSRVSTSLARMLVHVVLASCSPPMDLAALVRFQIHYKNL